MNKCEYCQKPIDHFNEDYLVLYRTRRDEQTGANLEPTRHLHEACYQSWASEHVVDLGVRQLSEILKKRKRPARPSFGADSSWL